MKTNIFLEKNETKLNYIVLLLLLQLKIIFPFQCKKKQDIENMLLKLM